MLQRMIMTCVVSVFVCTAIAGDDPKQDPNDKEGRAILLAAVQLPIRQLDGYQKWPMLTPGPIDVSESLFFRCNIGNPEAYKKLHDFQGPHWSPAVRVYANATAKAAIDAKKESFPQGSILVKEKLLMNKLYAITAMIRERDGYDRSADKNDWRYFYVDKFEEMQFGRIETCRTCHRKASKTDFAFLQYSSKPGYSYGP